MKQVCRLLIVLILVFTLTPVVAGTAESDIIMLQDGNNEGISIWLDSQDGETFVFNDGGFPVLGPLSEVSVTLKESNGFVLIARDDDGQFVLYHNLTIFFLLRNVRNFYEYLPGKFCAEFKYANDSNLYLWYMSPDFESQYGDINFGKDCGPVAFHFSNFGNSFFYAVNSKFELLTAKPQPSKGGTPKAKKLTTIIEGTVPVEGVTYLGYETPKGSAYTIDGVKSNLPKVKGNESVAFFEGFMLIYEPGSQFAFKLFPENPLPITFDEVFSAWDNETSLWTFSELAP